MYQIVSDQLLGLLLAVLQRYHSFQVRQPLAVGVAEQLAHCVLQTLARLLSHRREITVQIA